MYTLVNSGTLNGGTLNRDALNSGTLNSSKYLKLLSSYQIDSFAQVETNLVVSPALLNLVRVSSHRRSQASKQAPVRLFSLSVRCNRSGSQISHPLLVL